MSRFFIFFLTLLTCIIWNTQAFALSVDQIRIGAHPGKTRIVIELSAPANYKVFLLSDPRRIVIDLPEFEWRAGKVGDPASGIVGARFGSVQPGLSRIVLDLDRPVSIQSAFFIPGDSRSAPRLVIDFTPSTAERFLKELGDVHSNGPQPAPAAATQVTSAASIPAPRPKPQELAASEPKPLVVIDPGHGGEDPGATGPGSIREKNVTLALARELRRQLEDSGRYRVMMTRDRDVFIKLKDRVAFARASKADLFISIHADSIDKPGVQGASIYTLSEKASDEQSARLADRENRADLIAGIDLSTEDEDVASILVDLTMRDTMNQSRFFATRLSSIFSSDGIRLLEKPTRSAGFAVLKAPDIPSILLEAGFMSNRREAEMLNSPEHRKKIAASLKDGIDAYFERVRKNRKI